MWIDKTGTRHCTKTDKEILGFFDEYRFLSNFEMCKNRLEFGGFSFATSEHLYMALKTSNMESWKTLSENDSPSFARKFGQTISLRSDWNKVRIDAMRVAVYEKFSKNPELAERLLETVGYYLEETNNWGDEFWGVNWKTRQGENNLGKVLMEVRHSLTYM